MDDKEKQIMAIKKRIIRLQWKIDIYSNFPFGTYEPYDPKWEVELLGLREQLRDLEGGDKENVST